MLQVSIDSRSSALVWGSARRWGHWLCSFIYVESFVLDFALLDVTVVNVQVNVKLNRLNTLELMTFYLVICNITFMKLSSYRTFHISNLKFYYSKFGV